MKATGICLFLFMFLSCMNVLAQQEDTSSRKVLFQVRGGINISNVRATHDNVTFEGNEKVGFNIGAIADIPLGKDFYLHPGLLFTTKGVKVDDILVEDTYYKADMNAMYIQIPLHVGYKMQLERWDNRFGMSLGPYLAYGIGGKTDYTTKRGKASIGIDTFGSDYMWNRFDVGIGFEIYFELKRLVFTTGAEAGFTRTWKKEYLTDNINPRNSNYYICVGYKL